MSDADNQMGGHGGWTGLDPDEQSDEAPHPEKGNLTDDTDQEQEDKLDEEGEESFPASDPPGHR
ncbi:MAG TPA: hypothetical protein VKV06_10580 [Acidimicrobiales bacterium]|nr:hypothetical protein [Acidimicrobiales bacterium]